jgi:formylmethanofuran dehydrogenase subunit B
VASGEADCVLWLSAYRGAAPAWSREPHTIALTGRDARFRRPPRVHVEIGRPGIDHDAVEHFSTTGTLTFVKAGERSDALSVAQVLSAIAGALPEQERRPC